MATFLGVNWDLIVPFMAGFTVAIGLLGLSIALNFIHGPKWTFSAQDSDAVKPLWLNGLVEGSPHHTLLQEVMRVLAASVDHGSLGVGEVAVRIWEWHEVSPERLNQISNYLKILVNHGYAEVDADEIEQSWLATESGLKLWEEYDQPRLDAQLRSWLLEEPDPEGGGTEAAE